MTSGSKQFFSIIGLIFVTLIWGLTFIMVKWTVAELDVYYFLFLRFSIAFLVMFIFFRKRLFHVDRETLKSAFFLSIFLCGSFIAQTEGLKRTTATNTSMITGLYLVFIPIFSFIFFKTKARISSLIGVVLSLLGLHFLTQYSFSGLNNGDLLILICSLGYAWHVILTGRFTVRHKIVPLVVYQFLFVSVYFAVAMIISGGYTYRISETAWLTIAVTALLATVFALIVQTTAQRYIDSTRAGVIFALEAPFGAFFAWTLGGETLGILAFVGACLMVIGMILSEIHPVTKYLIDKIVNP